MVTAAALRTPTLGSPLRWLDARPLLCAILALEVAVPLLYTQIATLVQEPRWIEVQGGIDFRLYQAATASWLGGGPFYHPWQLAGPYDALANGPGAPLDVYPVLYPPTTLPLLVPFTVLPALGFLWWAVPLGIIGAVLVRLRPRPWVWPILVALGLHYTTFWLVVSGNPVMWAVAGVALGTLYGWPAVLALLKPTIGLAALIGVHRRSWWVAAAGFGLVALAFAPMWPDYVTATLNARISRLDYLASNVPLTLLPLVAWIARR